MRWLITQDLHQQNQKWKLLVEAVKTWKPEWVFITGDILPKDNFSLASQKYFLPNIAGYCRKMREAGALERNEVDDSVRSCCTQPWALRPNEMEFSGERSESAATTG